MLLDGDNREIVEQEIRKDGLAILRWERYESESYLLHPDSLYRFIEKENGALFVKAAKAYLEEQLPPAFFKAPLGTNAVLKAEPASKTLLPSLFSQAGISLEKSDYFLIAEQMTPEEIPSEITDKLNQIASVVCPHCHEMINNTSL